MNFATLSLWSVGALICALAAPGHAQDLKSALTYHVVVTDTDGTERLEARDSVRPGDVIEYEIAHSNGTDQDLSGLAIALPVPQGVTIALGAERSSLPASFEVQAEMKPQEPGLEWSTLPAFRLVTQVRREPLPAEAIAAVRWTLDTALPAGATALNAYRVTVN